METTLRRDRRVLPRWRALSRTPSSELQAAVTVGSGACYEDAVANLNAHYERWRQVPTIENAIEVVNSGLLVQEPFLALGPARIILAEEGIMPAVRSVAELVANGYRKPELDDTFESPTEDDYRRQIRETKQRLINEPRNGLLWLEKARLYTLAGEKNAAELSIRRALGCAPNNRFVLRGFARFMSHCGRYAEAHGRLRRSEAVKYDPWVQAAEIALAEASGKGPASVRYGRGILNQKNIAPAHTSELASALGTLEAKDGKTKRAKQLFLQSLLNPTENALSQAYWASEELKLNIDIDKKMILIDGAFEARFQSACREKKWRLAVISCERWLDDEPFSLRAAVEGSVLAASYLWDQKLALDFCDRGLVANPDDAVLLNNKLVSLCRMNNMAEAEKVSNKIKNYLDGENTKAFVIATFGLMHFRLGDIEKGRIYYAKAVDDARKNSNIDTEFRAKFHWLYEEARAGQLIRQDIHQVSSMLEEQKKYIPAVMTRHLWDTMKLRMEKFDIRSTGEADGGQNLHPALMLGI